MADYRLVPVVPDVGMVGAGARVLRRFPCAEKLATQVYRSMLSVAPYVQREPVSAQVRYRRPEKGQPGWSVWQPAAIMLDRPSWGIDSQGWEVEYRLLYTTTQPEPDVTRLVKALEQVIKAAPNGGPLWHGSEQIVEARAALAAYTNKGAV